MQYVLHSARIHTALGKCVEVCVIVCVAVYVAVYVAVCANLHSAGNASYRNSPRLKILKNRHTRDKDRRVSHIRMCVCHTSECVSHIRQRQTCVTLETQNLQSARVPVKSPVQFL